MKKEFSLKGQQARIFIRKGLEDLEPVLRAWAKVVMEYSESHEVKPGVAEDCCWWYGERATLSTLAAAAWRVKGWGALEEFRTIKNRVTGGKREPKYGRCDLYVYSDNSSYACEAKQVRLALSHPGATDKISNGLTAAWKDAGDLDKSEAGKRLALCFCVPYVKGNSRKGAVNEWIDDLMKTINYSALVAVFPDNSEALKNDSGYGYPGVVLIIQERHRANRQDKGIKRS